MSDTNDPRIMNDDDDSPVMDPPLRARLLAATTAQVRRGRRRTHLRRAAALTLAFAAGAATTVWLRPEPLSVGISAAPVLTSTGVEDPAEEYSPDVVDAAALYGDPEALAFAYDAADAESRLRLLKGAGDYELTVRNDIRAALEYYRQWIELADDSSRTAFDQSDTWLLASLKSAP